MEDPGLPVAISYGLPQRSPFVRLLIGAPSPPITARIRKGAAPTLFDLLYSPQLHSHPALILTRRAHD